MKLLVAGDQSHAGKSIVSLGLLSMLLEAGFLPSELAYIKPVTQCVSSTLTARFCEAMGIQYEHIGPLVFYRGCTRDLLDTLVHTLENENLTNGSGTESNELTIRCASAVERISNGKKLTIIDGVGYPAVGSIVGCSSADIAVACRAPVLLVGKPGVGDAIDSFNLCACFFEARHVPVLGAIFNKLPQSGFYGIDKCGEYTRKYMRVARPRQRVYGLLPASNVLKELATEEVCGLAYEHPKVPPTAGKLSDDDQQAINLITQLFREHVDMAALIADLKSAIERPGDWLRQEALYPLRG